MFIPGIKDIKLGDVSYKMFYSPFMLDKQQMLLCSFLKDSIYESKLHEIPASFIYPFVLLLLLLIVSLPIIKFYLMGPEEEVRFSDLFLFVSSLFIGSTQITLVIIQLILLRDGELRASENLGTLNNQISTNFTNEIGQVYNQLSVFDNLVANDPFVEENKNNIKKIQDSNYISKEIIEKYIRKEGDKVIYSDFERVAWSDSSGKQFLKGELALDPAYPNVKSRNYFTAFTGGQPYRVPGNNDSICAIEPLYNKVNGDFTTVVSKRSHVQNAFIASISAHMYSVTKTILPAGYNFCIINRNGEVQYHSDSSRNLQENFIIQLESPNTIEEAITSRQEIFINNARLYGKDYCLDIKPIENLPYFMITFYDRGYIVPVNMRILIFALMLCCVSFVMYMTLWFFLLWKGYYNRSLLMSPICYSNWINPKPKFGPIYGSCIVFFLLYITVVVASTIFLNYTEISNNYIILIVMLITPFNIAAALCILTYTVEDKTVSKKAWKNKLYKYEFPLEIIAGLIGVSSLINWLIFSFSSQKDYTILWCQTVFIILLVTYYFLKRKFTKYVDWCQKSYMHLYSFLGLLLIMAFAILPASLFTWYAHNQEIIQTVKKQQLYLASKISERKNTIEKSMGSIADIYDVAYFNRLFYQKGLYPLYNDKFDLAPNNAGRVKNNFDEFYFNISDRISVNYYDPESFPALKDTATDYSWHWNYFDSNRIVFSYKMPPDIFKNNLKTGSQNTMLYVKSKQPDRYILLSDPRKLSFLIITCCLIFLVIYTLIHTTIAKVFLKKYITALKNKNESDLSGFIAVYKSFNKLEDSKDTELRKWSLNPNSYSTYPHRCNIAVDEKATIDEINDYRSFYNYLWQKCSDKQKLLLYNFSKDGLMNFKNTHEIYALIKNGILTIHSDEEICLFRRSFRAYILTALPDSQLETLRSKSKSSSTWHSFRTPLLIILLLVAGFIFFTQQETWQRIVALITGFGSSLPLLINIFTRTSAAAKK